MSQARVKASANSERELPDTPPSTSCYRSCKPPDGYPIQRKVTDPSGRLGSLYDTSTDNLVDRHSVGDFASKRLQKPSVCRVFSGHGSRDLVSFLRNVDFEDSVRQSISLQMVQPTGTGRLIEYDQPITQNTRFLYYSYRPRQDKLRVSARKADRIVSPPSGPTKATHMITKILWGIEILCVIQIPKTQNINVVDELLRRIRIQLEKNRFPIQLSNNDRQIISRLDNVTVFGTETCIGDPNTPILSILTNIPNWQRGVILHQPLTYTMQPLRWLYNNIQFQQPCMQHVKAEPHVAEIQQILKRIENQIKELDELLQNLPTSFSSQTLNQRLKDAKQQYRFLLDSQENLETRLQKVIPDVRRNSRERAVLDNIIEDKRYSCLRKDEIDKFLVTVKGLSITAALIEKLKNGRIEYINAFDVCLNRETATTNGDIITILKRSFLRENGLVILWYSTNRLKREQANRWEQIYRQLISKRQQAASPIKLVYVDFTNCRQLLSDFGTDTLSGESSPLSPPSPVIPPSPVTPPSPIIEFNVLLLGETGVGKSTFINAFVNYLKFETLQQAERGEPVVLIPVSFLITVGDQFDEFIVKFGNVDPNENHEHEGQSVTQQCKSYVFNLNDDVRLRLIDTPGIGDTRGVAQDVKNIDHILTYVNSLSHLDAICLLLKPNASRLNVFFRSCVNQLLTYLTPVGYNNIIFCFTNSRATFYAPGDTGPLLRKMLNDEHLNTIPFQKDNTFCFDSESFRYLAARKCNIDFDNYQKDECTSSWNTSVKESVRLLNFIQNLEPYNFEEWQSPRKAALDIVMLARPLMETLRLIIYNWKISETKLIGSRIELNSNPVAIEMCTHCAQINVVEVGPFWLTQYQPVPLKTNANQHRLCPVDGSHFLVEAIVEHELVAQPAGLKNERWQTSFHNFLFKCDRLHHFLRQQGPSAQDDPFEPIIERFLEEEQQISQIRNINSIMNRRVREVLQSINQIRQQNSQRLFSSNERLSLNQVYQIIAEFLAMGTVRKQIDCIKRSRQLKMAAYELKISENIIQNRTFVSDSFA